MKRFLRKLWRYAFPLRCGHPCVFTSRSPQGMGKHKNRCPVRAGFRERSEPRLKGAP